MGIWMTCTQAWVCFRFLSLDRIACIGLSSKDFLFVLFLFFERACIYFEMSEMMMNG